MFCLIFALIFITNASAQTPKPPTGFPSSFYSWMVTSVSEASGLISSKGQMIAFSNGAFASRFNEQDLRNITEVRRADFCDGKAMLHFEVDDSTGKKSSDPPCSKTCKQAGKLSPPMYPVEFLKTATFIGVDPVNQKNCNHFNSPHFGFPGPNDQPWQMDLWTDVKDGLPCQISIKRVAEPQLTTFAFDGFTTTIPANTVINVAQLLCPPERSWTCQAKESAAPAALQNALSWLCGGHLDCTAINPGGSHYIPNTIVDHCNWAFDKYYRSLRLTQGLGACNFGGVAVLAKNTTSLGAVVISDPSPCKTKLPQASNQPIFTIDLICQD